MYAGSMVETERYQALLEVSKSIAAHTSLHALLPDLKSCLEKLVHFDALTLVLYDEERQTTRLHVLATNLPNIRKAGVEYSIADTPAGVVLETGKPLYVGNVLEETRFPKIRQLLIEYGCNSYCTVPLNTARRCVGFLTFGSTHLDAYTPEDLDFIEQAGMQVAVAVENALNYEQAVTLQTALAKERDRLKLLLEVNNALVSELGLRELFQAIARQLKPGVDGCGDRRTAHLRH